LINPEVSSFDFDVSRWPIVVLTIHGDMTDDEQDQMFSKFEDLWSRGRRFLTVTDASEAGVGNAVQRKRIAEWMKANAERAQRLSLGSIIVIKSDVIRGAMRAIAWISQTDFESEYVADLPRALARARALLDERQDSLPPPSRFAM